MTHQRESVAMFTVSAIKKQGTAHVRDDLAGIVGTLTKPPWDTGTDTKDSLGTFRQGAKPQR